jgi:hypothetical protein
MTSTEAFTSSKSGTLLVGYLNLTVLRFNFPATGVRSSEHRAVALALLVHCLFTTNPNTIADYTVAELR